MSVDLFDPTLHSLSQFLDDIEGLRKASANRMRILTATEPDDDGVMRGFGLDDGHPVVATLGGMLDSLTEIEKTNIKELQRVMKKHPLGAWVKKSKGVGEKQAARLLAAIGDPYMRPEMVYEDGTVVPAGPRTVSQLWAYCGLHVSGGEAVRRRKGVQSNWSTDAKTRAYLVATSCIKTPGPYREVYLARRAHTATTHADWTLGHSHNDALRFLSKRILRDLWSAAREIHEAV